MKFNRWTLLGYVALMGLFMSWTQYKSKQARTLMTQQRADSLARVESKRLTENAANTARERKGDATMSASTSNTGDTGNMGTASATNQAVATVTLGAGASASDSLSDSVPVIPARKVTVKNKHFTVVFDNRGAQIAELRVDELHGKPVFNHILISEKEGGALSLSLNRQDLSQILWQVDAVRSNYDLKVDSLRIAFTARLKNGQEVKRIYTVYADSENISHKLIASSGFDTWALEWKAGLSESEEIVDGKGIGLLSSYYSELVFDNGTNATRESFTGAKTFNSESGVLRWVGLRRKYVAAIINFGQQTTDRVDAEAKVPDGQESSYPHNFSLKVSNNQWEEGALNFNLVVLPLQYDRMKMMGQNYEQILFTGWEWFLRADIWYVKLCGLVLHLLKYFHSVVPNWGIAIIMLTLLVRFVTLPLTLSQTRAMARLAEHQPEITKIRDKYKSEPQKAHQAMMAYYKEVGISPLAPVLGCVPMLFQMPIFISLFNVLGRSVELKGAYFFGWITDLSQPDVVLAALKIPYVFPVGLTILPFFMAATMYFQMKATIKDPNQKAMIWLMPIMMFLFSCSFPSGLVLYWTVSNVFTIGQTWVQTGRKKKVEVLKPGKPIVGKRPPSSGKG